MAFFLLPTSGNAVGGGGHGIIDPPPPGIDPGAGARSEVDTVNRRPLRLLRSAMNKHKPKFMRVVPPGQARGTMAPPYAWDPAERDDWRYEQPRKIKEDHSLDALGAPPAAAAQSTKFDFRTARRQFITRRIQQLKSELSPLLMRRHELEIAGRAHLQSRLAAVEDLQRSPLVILEGQTEPPLGIPGLHTTRTASGIKRHVRGPAEEDPGWLAKLERRRAQQHPAPLGLSRNPLRSINRQRRVERVKKLTPVLGPRPEPSIAKPASPPQSGEIISLTNRINQIQAEIDNLEKELATLKATTPVGESIRLGSNNLRRLSLLLK